MPDECSSLNAVICSGLVLKQPTKLTLYRQWVSYVLAFTKYRYIFCGRDLRDINP